MNAAASVVEVRVPDMGNFKDVAVIDVLVKPGDSIAIDTPLVTLESDPSRTQRLTGFDWITSISLNAK